jgi:hypothetical protein
VDAGQQFNGGEVVEQVDALDGDVAEVGPVVVDLDVDFVHEPTEPW